MVYLYVLLGLLALFLGVVIIRTLNFKVKENAKAFDEEITFDTDKAVENLRTLVRF